MSDFNKAQSNTTDDNLLRKISNGVGLCYTAQTEYDKAIVEFDDAIKDDPENIEFLSNRAKAYYHRAKNELLSKEKDKADSDFEMSIKDF